MNTNTEQNVRYAFHSLDVKLSSQDGMEIQTVQMSKDSGISSRRIKVPELSVLSVAEFLLEFPLSALALELQDSVYSLQRAHVLRKHLLNGAESVSSTELTLAALSTALEGSGIVRITKELIVSLFDSVLGNSLAALIAEAKGLTETCSEEEILALAGPSLKLFRALFLGLAIKDFSLELRQAEQMKKVIAFALRSELIPASGSAGAADSLLRAIDARVADVVEF